MKWTGRLRQLMSGQQQEQQPTAPAPRDDRSDESDNEGWQYINYVRSKLDKLVEDFAKGRVNRAQFEELYTHYQEERKVV